MSNDWMVMNRKATIPLLIARTEENFKKRQPGAPVFRPRIKPGTLWTRSTRVTPVPVCCFTVTRYRHGHWCFSHVTTACVRHFIL